ncbi:MAG TPA: single-stranded-DNA-specific exonuclease RecJ [Algoriphagus sp.]|jgi:single-stranded-DNA-specific exonuclease|uniref:Single-stranded-DNA-specific exonuclease RecJ n=1 Tax=Algoriphagus ornithinivorans TaxID=226506 RepID=A0A1I5FVY6_9BACT|nr:MULTISPECIES: single-stranded-DNA-specific exonuclease RecJ [Algoriphagus]MAL15984.1 single-stranded-DNA-specific exonuclease RecJ [Algoriphagus sp.]QYH40604.1 single-stranded-DNA-specific exonuclease RecJ [Algoriphagus sp. NBT04N3]SFO27930.1 exonuclease RecJ [Algoriphagus ornithinivorans]HAD52886.1 single-stranded-DNA-specific exonuclease RecJ [Algoriphagus sp.]HAH37743.1 single-stranded-DNA-specific exonuclease RecJ [Algoriphagus sp.]|tara:strand:+ start:493 stop:2217 length:1725 start_codon:yes stop_codon:yes gene_type:complete
MEYVWKQKPKASQSTIEKLGKEINVNPILSNMLINRGVESFDQAKDYFRPSLSQLHDPFLMQDMHQAVTRIEKAIANQEKILVYGDYDVDGTTAVALVYSFLKGFYPLVDFYIPDRYKEGYGISERGVRYAAENDFALVIALDCGIKAIDKVNLASQLDVDFIICDHHTPGEELPKAIAVLDAKREDCNYPYKELSGCGVGFKLIQAIAKSRGMDESNLYAYLDLLVVSIAADIVPITGENRILAYYGLDRINNTPRAGLKALILRSKIEKEIGISDIVFKIGPRINASGRLEHAKASVELLISTDLEEAIERAKVVDEVNATRRNFDENITREAFEMIAEREEQAEWNSTVLFKEDWHKGVIGIVASRCIEKYYRPTIILTESNAKATGSARSVVDFDIYEAIAECSDLLDQFGGHKYAAGLTLSVDNVPAFQAKFEQVVKSRIEEVHRKPVIEVDDELLLDQINYKFHNILKQMAPFGPGNTEPVFRISNVYAEDVAVLKDKHLRFKIVQDGQLTTPVCLGFGMADRAKDPDLTTVNMLRGRMRFDIVAELRENFFRDKSSLQLYVKDIKFD